MTEMKRSFFDYFTDKPDPHQKIRDRVQTGYVLEWVEDDDDYIAETSCGIFRIRRCAGTRPIFALALDGVYCTRNPISFSLVEAQEKAQLYYQAHKALADLKEVLGEKR